MRKLTLIALAATISVPVLAQGDRHDPNKQVCRTTTVAGTRLVRERICLTQRQWDTLREASQRKHTENLDASTKFRFPGT